MPAVSLIQLPYDSGRFDERMGCGPDALIANGLADTLRERGFEVDVISIRLPDAFQTEGSALVELQRRGVAAAREAIARGAKPIF